jgi:uncharacterized protein (DUF2147 family)
MWCNDNAGEGMKRTMILAIVCILVVAASEGGAAQGDDILGLWSNQEGDARIEIYLCGGKYCGKIVWIKEWVYPADDPRGRAGQPRLDDNNPDQKLRNRPVVGLQIMDGFIFNGDDDWTRGTVYDPKNGKTYRGRMTLVRADRLYLRGYVLFSFFGRTTTWRRLNH